MPTQFVILTVGEGGQVRPFQMEPSLFIEKGRIYLNSHDVREEHIVNIESNSYNYLTGVYYMDVLSELEKIGDFMINISQAAKSKHEN